MDALDSEGVEELSVWRIHRKIGMNGGLFTNHLKRETGVEMARTGSSACRRKHARACRRMSVHIRPLPGARALAWLSNAALPWTRHQRANGDVSGQPRRAWRQSGE
jgi:hypothetical protein